MFVTLEEPALMPHCHPEPVVTFRFTLGVAHSGLGQAYNDVCPSLKYRTE